MDKFICAMNLRTLLISLLLYNKEEAFFCISIRDNNKIYNKMKKYGYNVINVEIDSNECLVKKFFRKIKIQQRIRDLISYYNKINMSFDSFIGYDHEYSILKFFIDKCEIVVLEEGTANYTEYSIMKKVFKDNIIKKIAMLLLGQYRLLNYKPFGYDDRVKKVILTGFSDVPLALINKVELISIVDLWESLDEESQQIYNDIFSFNPEHYRNKIIFLSQPARDLTEYDLIKFYKKHIMDNDEYTIKLHPLEINIYKKYFNKAIIDDTKFPFELIKLNKIIPKKVINVMSTAALDFEGVCEVEYIDYDL